MSRDIHKVIIVCTDQEAEKEVGALLKRVSSALSTLNTFVEAMIKVDEDKPGAQEQAWPLFSRMMMTFIAIYPNADQFTEDIKSIGDFTVLNTKDKNDEV